MAKRRNFTDQFKTKIALEAPRGDKTVQEIAAKHQLHPFPAGICLRTPIGKAGQHMEAASHRRDGRYVLCRQGERPNEGRGQGLHAKSGRLAVEYDFLSEGLKR